MASRHIPRISSPGTGGQGPPPMTTQTIRDAHVIVVGQLGYLANTFPNENPATVGVTADYIDTGNGAQLAAALAVVAAAGQPVDVRIRPCAINLGGVGHPVTPLLVPGGSRLIGAGGIPASLSTFTAPSGVGGTTQDVFTLGNTATLEDVGIIVPGANVAAVAGQAIVRIPGNASRVKHCQIAMAGGADIYKTTVAIGTAGAVANQQQVDDVMLFLPSVPGAIAYIGIQLGAFGLPSNLLFTQDPVVKNVAQSGGEISVLLADCAGGIIENLQHYDAVVSTQASGIAQEFSPGYGANAARGMRITDYFYQVDPAQGGGLGSQAIGILVLQTNTNLSEIQHAEFENCRIILTTNAGQPNAIRSGIFFNVPSGGVNGSIREAVICNVNIAGGRFGVHLLTATNDNTTSAAGAIDDVHMTNINVFQMTRNGFVLEQTGAGTASKVRNCGIHNCGAHEAPGAGFGVSIGAHVLNTIVVGNHLQPNGGTALQDLGTGTQAGLNVLV